MKNRLSFIDQKVTLDKELEAQQMTVHFGPQHPSTHGVFRIDCTLDGEVVVDAKSHIGYLHRGIEKLVETRTYPQCMPFTDRLDYVAAMANNICYAQAVEKLLDIQVPERVEYARVIVAELQRIASHYLFIGTMGVDVGALTLLWYGFDEREKYIDIFQKLSGARLTYNYMRIGGLSYDLYEGFAEEVRAAVDSIPRTIEEYHQLLAGNEIFLARTKGVGILDPQKAFNYGCSGPWLRASGIPYDIRKVDPYGIYDRFDFKVCVRENGDIFDRWMIRLEEMEESRKIILQALKDLPEGPYMAKVPRNPKPQGEIYHRVETPRGELGMYIVGDGTVNPYRWHVRTPSFLNLSILDKTVIGSMIADMVMTLASIDIVLGESDK